MPSGKGARVVEHYVNIADSVQYALFSPTTWDLHPRSIFYVFSLFFFFFAPCCRRSVGVIAVQRIRIPVNGPRFPFAGKIHVYLFFGPSYRPRLRGVHIGSYNSRIGFSRRHVSVRAPPAGTTSACASVGSGTVETYLNFNTIRSTFDYIYSARYGVRRAIFENAIKSKLNSIFFVLSHLKYTAI